MIEPLVVEQTSRFAGISSYEADLIPFDNQGASLGSSNNKFASAHIDNITLGETDAQEIKTSTGDLNYLQQMEEKYQLVQILQLI